MKSFPILLSTPHLTGEEVPFIQEALSFNWIESDNSAISLFEESIEGYLGTGFVTALNSGTSAIHLGLLLLDVQRGDEVICQSMTFTASANPIIYQGATPVFVDSERDTWNMCPIFLEEAILDRISNGKKPKAIIAVHLYGTPYNVNLIHAVANRYEIPVLEDAAEALGSSYKGIKCGSFGEVGIYSFNNNKIITSSGGGALITSSKEEKEKVIFYATQSRDDKPYYQHSEIGYNYRISPLCAALGRGQLKILNKRVISRKDMHDFYSLLFLNKEGISVFSVANEDYDSNYWLTTILCESQEQLFSLKRAFEIENIETRFLWKPLHLQPIFENHPYYGGQIAKDLFERGLCLPSGSNLNEEDRCRITEVVVAFFDQKNK